LSFVNFNALAFGHQKVGDFELIAPR
jgi:hypothetical protein